MPRAHCDAFLRTSVPACYSHAACNLYTSQTAGGVPFFREIFPRVLTRPKSGSRRRCLRSTRPNSRAGSLHLQRLLPSVSCPWYDYR